MPIYGFSLHPVVNGGSEITQSNVYLARQTVDRVLNRRGASAIVLSALNSPPIAYVKIERVDLADTVPMSEAVR